MTVVLPDSSDFPAVTYEAWKEIADRLRAQLGADGPNPQLFFGANESASSPIDCPEGGMAIAAAPSAHRVCPAASASLELTEFLKQVQLCCPRASAAPEAFEMGLVLESKLFVSVAKLRAARVLWARYFGGLGCDEAPQLCLQVEAQEEGDESDHIFRVILTAMAGQIGGADSLLLSPIRGLDLDATQAEWLGRAIPLILNHEAHLGRVCDSAAGSSYVETLTGTLVRDTWELFSDKRECKVQASASGRAPTSLDSSSTPEGISIKKRYGREDVQGLEAQIESMPGFAPFVRGPYATMYSSRPWTIRQYAGFGAAEESNLFYKSCLSQGQTGLSIAFDLPTHRGYDSDHLRAEGDVGMAGVAVDSILDMQALFDGISLEALSVSMTMNGAVLPVLALYIVAAEEQGAKLSRLSGTVQNDILKEFMVRNTYIYPPGPSLRIVGDIFAYTAKNMPRFNSISVSGYHMQEAGAPADLELAYTIADAIQYVEVGKSRGLSVDDFAPRFSFFFGTGMDFFMEIAKLRAARLLWAKVMRRAGASDPKSMCLRTHCQTSGWSLQPTAVYGNVVRTAVEALAAVYGHTQSLHTNAFDEAHALPTEASAQVARSTQIFLRDQAGTTDVIDPWGGSYYIEWLTAQLISRAEAHMAEIDLAGGMHKAIEAGIPKARIEAAAARTQARIDSAEQKIIGLNLFELEAKEELSVRRVDNKKVLAAQRRRLHTLRQNRDETKTQAALEALFSLAAEDRGNLLEGAVEAARARATVGEISFALQRVFGRYENTAPAVQGVYGQAMSDSEGIARLRRLTSSFLDNTGRRPRILVAKIGQDGHDRGQRVVASAFADFGFDVDMGPLFQTPEEVGAQAVENDVHIVGVSTLAAAHLSHVPALVAVLAKLGRADIHVAVGGIIPSADHAALTKAGARAIFGPGTTVPQAAESLLRLLNNASV